MDLRGADPRGGEMLVLKETAKQKEVTAQV